MPPVQAHARWGTPMPDDAVPGYRQVRRRAALLTVVMTEIQEQIANGDCDDVNPYSDSTIIWAYRGDEDPDLVKLWLRRHARAMREIARRMGVPRPVVEKRATDGSYQLHLQITPGFGGIALRATVDRDLICDLRPTGEYEVIPEKRVPKMERVCPPSILDGILDEVEL
jgi:hypothetical protein